MGIKVQYVGARSYCEIMVDKQKQGFSRNMIKELPTEYVERHIRPQIEIGGSKAWLIVDDTETKSKAMKAVVEETVPEPVAEPVAEETIDVDYSSMTRFQLMAIAKERGHTVKNTTKKADLLEMLSE
jgi:hypothetical protein